MFVRVNVAPKEIDLKAAFCFNVRSIILVWSISIISILVISIGVEKSQIKLCGYFQFNYDGFHSAVSTEMVNLKTD